MNSENYNKPSTFFKQSHFSDDYYKAKEIFFKNNKSEPQLIIQKGQQLLQKLHGNVLEEGFPETLALFESNNLVISIPEKFDVEILGILVKYFYFREISPSISIAKTFQLMNLAVFFKVQPLIKEIKEFLSLIANSVETEAEQIFKYSLDSYILFQNTETLEDFKQILYQSMSFLIKKGNKNEILKYFNSEFFKKLENNQIVEESFTFFVEIIKT